MKHQCFNLLEGKTNYYMFLYLFVLICLLFQKIRYLIDEKRRNFPKEALDVVEHFHLGNGARIESINFQADKRTNSKKKKKIVERKRI